MDRKLILVVVSVFLGLIAFIFGVVGVSTINWRTGGGNIEHHDALGLWRKCANNSCSDLYVGENRAFYAFEMVRGFGILSVITAFAGVTFGILMVLVKKWNIGNTIPATFYLMSGAFGIICASVFASLDHTTTTGYGYSFILTWIAAPLAIIAGGINVVPALSA